MVTGGEGIARGLSSVRAGSMRILYRFDPLPNPAHRYRRAPVLWPHSWSGCTGLPGAGRRYAIEQGALEPPGPEDYGEQQRGEDQSHDVPDKRDDGDAYQGDARAADVEGAEHGGADEERGGDDGEDEAVCEHVDAPDQLVQAAVLELDLELPVGELAEELPHLLWVLLHVPGVLQRPLRGDLGYDLRPVPLGEQPLCVRTRHLVDVYGRVYGPGESLGGYKCPPQQGGNPP